MTEETRGLPDLLAPGLAVVFCGLNPGLSSASEQQHFHNRSNRFWRVLHLAGFTSWQLEPQESSKILRFDCGLTTAISRPTVSARELSAFEFRNAAPGLEEKIVQHGPRYIAFLGKSAYAAISGRKEIPWGIQPGLFGGANVWVLPNTSGLNRAFRLDQLVEAYRELYRAAFANQ